MVVSATSHWWPPDIAASDHTAGHSPRTGVTLIFAHACREQKAKVQGSFAPRIAKGLKLKHRYFAAIHGIRVYVVAVPVPLHPPTWPSGLVSNWHHPVEAHSLNK